MEGGTSYRNAAGWIVTVALFASMFVVIGMAIQMARGEATEDRQFIQGRYVEANAIIQVIEQELRYAERDERRARSAIRQAAALGRIEALKVIEHAVDQDSGRYFQGTIK